MFLGKDFLVDSDDEQGNQPSTSANQQPEKFTSSTTPVYKNPQAESVKKGNSEYGGGGNGGGGGGVNLGGNYDSYYEKDDQLYGVQSKPSYGNQFKSPTSMAKQSSTNSSSGSKRPDMNNMLYTKEEDNEDIPYSFNQPSSSNNNNYGGSSYSGMGGGFSSGGNYEPTNMSRHGSNFQGADNPVPGLEKKNSVARPGSASVQQRMKMLEQQKAMLTEKNKMQIGNVTSNPMYNPALSGGGYRNSDINYDHLQSLVQENKGQVYEPGMGQMKSNLPVLNKTQDNFIRAKNPEADVTEKKKPVTSQTQSSSQQQSQTQPAQSQNEKPNVAVKKLSTMELSEDDSEDEEKMMQERIKEAEKIKEKNKKAKHDEKVLMSDEVYQKTKASEEKKQPDLTTQPKALAQEQRKEPESKPKDDDYSEDNPANLKPLINVEISDMRAFLTRPAPTNGILQCSIKRDRSGFGRFFPKYHIYFSNGFRHLMSAKKRANNKTSNYLITMDKKDMSKKSQGFLGKLRSNFLGTEFHIYDGGLNPKKSSNSSVAREELGVILYESNLLGARGPRKMKVSLPEVKKGGEIISWKPNSSKDGILQAMKVNKMDGLRSFTNKPPKWNEHVQAFVLNFNGRVDKPSVKNFQLIDENDDSIIYLQFGRVADDIFNIDFQWPITPLQAFAISLSSFDYKIACE